VGYAKRVDRNHTALMNALRRTGWIMCSTAVVGEGFADAVGWHPVWRELRLFEFKTKEGKLTVAQQAFHAAWPVTVLRDVEDVLALTKEKAA
jgi:hypothetical protein